MNHLNTYCVRRVTLLTFILVYGLSFTTHADSLVGIQANNLALQNAIIQSSNSGSVNTQGNFGNSQIAGGAYNSISITASGVSVSALNANQNTGNAATSNINTQSISGISITTNNSGAVNSTGSFQNISMSGSNNSASVQAAGSSVSISNINR